MRHRIAAVLGAGALAALAVPGVAAADDLGASQGLRKAVSTQGITQHLEAFQGHADLNGGNRVGGSPGYEASANYVTARLEAAGYTVQDHFFNFVFNADRTPAVLQQVSPDATTYVDGNDFSSMTSSPNGDVTAQVWAVDLVVPSPGVENGNSSGCQPADFAGFPAGQIALVQRGSCSFAIKAQNAANAGATGVIVFNEGQTGRTGVINGTLGGPQTHSAPVVGTTFAVGQDLRNGVLNGDTGSIVRLRVDRINEPRTTRNLIAERAGETDRVVVAGAHLDSVSRGPGINDNGSGSATILEVAEAMAERGITPRNTVRFMWYGAEEFGLLGSAAYVSSLPQAELDRVEAMLNFDMIASPNFVRFVYDGDNSAFPVGPNVQDGPDGSGAIEALFSGYFSAVGLESAPTPFNGRSDYGPWIAKGVPAGGLFTGAEGEKTAQQAAIYGGTAGVAFDHCYHLACDTIANVNQTGLDQMSDAVAHVALTLAKRNFAKSPLVDPAPAPGGGSGGGGGLHDDHDHEEDAS